MIFGNKNTFAIEANFYQGDNYVFISYCFWANNQKIGDNSQTCVLTSELSNIRYNLENKGSRVFYELSSYSPEEIFSYLNYHLWGLGKSKINIDNLEGLIRLTVIKDYNTCFDGIFCYLLENESHDMLIWNNEQNKTKSFNIPKGQFYKAFNKVDNWIKSNTRLILTSN